MFFLETVKDLSDKSNFGNFILDAIRDLFISLDGIVYALFTFLYDLFVFVAGTDISSKGKITAIVDRFWILIGVFALFGCAFAVIRGIVSPELLSDDKKSNKGMGAIIKRAIIAVILLVSLNSIFKEAMDIQKNVIFSGNSNIVSRLLGISNDTTKPHEYNPGAELATDIFFGFFKENNHFPSGESASLNNYVTSEEIKSFILSNYGTGDSVTIFANWTVLNNYSSQRGIDGQENYYVFDYHYGLSTLTGIFLIYIMLNYCFSVGVRVYKLLLLKIIAPLPIIMSISDPNQASLKKWGKQCFSTYIDVVVKLLIINLVFVFSNVVMELDLTFEGVSDQMIFWVRIVLILSALMFAKKAMEMLKDIFPFMGDTGLGLKKMFADAFGAGTIGGAVVGFAGATAGLGAKKLISGIDSAKHGKGFMAGARKVQGKGPLSKFNKWYDGLTPNRIEHRNKLDLANATIADRNKMYAEGEKLYNKFNGSLSAEAFDNSEFRNSWQNVEDAKKAAKAAGTAQATAQAELEAAANRSYKDEAERASAIKTASDNVEKANGALKAAEGALSKRKELHEQMRLKYEKDARKEDSFDYYKKSTSQEERDAALNSATSSSATNNSTTARGPGFTGSVGNGVSPETNNNSSNNIKDNNNSPRNFFGDDGGETGE